MLDFPSVTLMTNRDRGRRIESLARDVLVARVRGDLRAVAARLAPNFAYRAHGAWPLWPYHAGPIEKAHFVESLARTNVDFELLEADIHEFLIDCDCDCAALHVTFTARNRGAGSPVPVDVWLYLRFLDVLIVEAATYVDAAKAARLLPAGVVEIQARERPGGASRASAGCVPSRRWPSRTRSERPRNWSSGCAFFRARRSAPRLPRKSGRHRLGAPRAAAGSCWRRGAAGRRRFRSPCRGRAPRRRFDARPAENSPEDRWTGAGRRDSRVSS